MPTYDYRCPGGHDSELFFRKISDAPAEVRCPVCGADAVRRVSGGAGLVFKGSGFYLTDYGKNAHRKPAADAAKGDGAREGGDAKPDSSKSDTGSAAASDATPAKPAAKSESTKPAEKKASSTKSKSGDGQ